MKSRKTKKKLIAVSMAAAILLPLPLASVHAASPSTTAKNEAMLVKIHLKNRADLDKLLSYGMDLTENLDQHAGQGMEADAILTKEEMEILQLRGYKTDVISTQHEIQTLRQERQFTVQQEKTWQQPRTRLPFYEPTILQARAANSCMSRRRRMQALSTQPYLPQHGTKERIQHLDQVEQQRLNE